MFVFDLDYKQYFGHVHLVTFEIFGWEYPQDKTSFGNCIDHEVPKKKTIRDAMQTI